ncbi:hypothetical protein VFPPC_06510 [Pochonia chlamydosporia 170]|uniref:F-box domain-containing protein n=1 Tax=Pochonia chlamydosporia 170 TaxID=1380566 RepID=A0A179FIS6_METCM|nr:hypothetical protein VFPPC_06510 [Pochonia chlamydosporia 170]OAQ65414.1 hypothetical protein VFPPC_06510 [Pochonia chlamydosporia 170]
MGLLLGQLPVELRQAVLEELPSLHDLHRAILSCKSLYDAYQTSRTLIRQRVFHHQVFGPESFITTDTSSFTGNVDIAEHIVARLEKVVPQDGLILRQVLWQNLLSFDQGIITGSMKHVVRTLSLALALAYRRQDGMSEAQHTEIHALRLLCGDSQLSMDSKTTDLVLGWLHDVVTNCSGHRGNLNHLIQLCMKISKFLPVAEHKSLHSLSKAFSDAILRCCKDEPKAEGKAMVDDLWLALEEAQRLNHPSGEYCFHCLETAKALVETTDSIYLTSETTISNLQRVWRTLPIRSQAFETWSHLFIASHGTSTCDGVFKVWTRLRDSPDPSPDEFESCDLEWARQVMVELSKHDGHHDRRITFQHSVFNLMRANTPKKYAFGRNLADEYAKRGQIAQAILMREEIGQGIDAGSNVYKSWAMSLKKLYQTAKREEDVDRMDACISRATQAKSQMTTVDI